MNEMLTLETAEIAAHSLRSVSVGTWRVWADGTIAHHEAGDMVQGCYITVSAESLSGEDVDTVVNYLRDHWDAEVMSVAEAGDYTECELHGCRFVDVEPDIRYCTECGDSYSTDEAA